MKPISLDDLGEIEIRRWLRGETPPITEDMLRCYTPDGELIPGRFADAYAISSVIREKLPPLRSRMFYRAGMAMYVSTAYLPWDHNPMIGGPVQIWETMVSTQRGWLDVQVRYASRAAAHVGHRQVTHAIAQAQRYRRMRQAWLAPQFSQTRMQTPGQAWFAGAVVRG